MVYGLIGEGLWSSRDADVRGFPRRTTASSLPPSSARRWLCDLADGIRWARLLQASRCRSSPFRHTVWARRLASTGWAVAAAAITLAAPALHYAGFLMTEPLTLVVVTAALLMLARALEEPSTWRYGIFVAWTTAAAAVRLQALVLLPAFLVAAVIDALAARDRRRLRPLVGLGAVAALVALAVGAIVVATGGELTRRSMLGAYTPVGESAPRRTARVSARSSGTRSTSRCSGSDFPLLAFAALARRRVRAPRPRTRACARSSSTALAYAALLVLQVGLFSSVYVGAVAERYLLTVLPLLAIALCTWIAAGRPAERRVVVPVWAVLVLLAAMVPLDQLVGPGSIVNTLDPLAAVGARSETAQRVPRSSLAALAARCARRLPADGASRGSARSSSAWPRRSSPCDTARRIVDASAHEHRATMRLRRADLARRRRARGRDDARDGRSSLDIGRAHGVLESLDPGGAQHPAGRGAVPARRPDVDGRRRRRAAVGGRPTRSTGRWSSRRTR